ncbi:MAG: FtsH protease activity modulator HflK [Alcanivoracaceae bacterium]|nr:FtsH protease activity modulator HflK [Alcanivoracaceae bacterium]
MAWNEPGGNKNNDTGGNKGNDGKKPNNPWGSGGNQPPDLEQLITNFFNNIKKVLGMNNNSNGGSAFPIFLVLLAIAVYGVWTSAHKIGPSERGVVLVFGEYSKTMTPGLNFTWPKPISEVYKVDISQLYSVGEKGEMLTEDKNLVFLEFDIQYRIRESKVTDYLFMLENPESTVKHAAESAVRQVVGTNTMSHLLNENREVAINNIVEELQAMLDQYTSGIQVTNFNFKEVHPPAQVKGAFDDVVKAREDAKTFINEANEYARQEIPLAEGDALKIVQEAEAYKQAIIAKSEGESQQFDLVREQYELAPEVTRERLYLETMENVFSRTSKVLIDSENSNNMMYLPLDQMLKNSKKTNESIYLGTTTVTVPAEKSNSSYERSSRNSTSKLSRRGRQ